MSYFIFNGTDSRSYGIFERMPPLPAPITNITSFAIPGRPESLSISEIDMTDISIQCVLGLKDLSKRRDINRWLRGSGELILSGEPDKKYNVRNVVLSPEYLSARYGKIGITFVCSPLVYNIENTPVEVTSCPEYIPVSGTYYSEPIYELHFTSDTEPQEFTFAVNGQEVKINLTAEHLQHPITLNAISQKIYYSDTKYLILSDTTGLIPYFNYGGNNLVEWSPSIVDKVIITKNERWL